MSNRMIEIFIELVLYRPDGYLYDKMAIIEYMVHQKKNIAKKMREYEKQAKRTRVTTVIITN